MLNYELNNMGLTNITVYEGDIHIPDALSSIMSTLNLTLAIWCEDSNFSAAVRNYLLFVTTVLQYNVTIDIKSFPSAVVLLVFQNVSTVTMPVYNVNRNSRGRYVLVTNELKQVDGIPNHETWLQKKLIYRATKFIWINFYGRDVQYYTYNCETNTVVETSVDAAVDLLTDLLEPKQIPNFYGKEVFVSVDNYSVYSYMEPFLGDETNGWDTDGIQLLLTEYALKRMNLTPVYSIMSPDGYSLFQKNTSSFTPGMHLDVYEMRMDVGVAGLFFKPGSLGLIEMSYPWHHLCSRYLVPRPQQLKSSNYILTGIFSKDVWYTLLFVFLMTSITALVIAWLIGDSSHKEYKSPTSCVIWMLFHLLQMKYPNRSEYTGSLAPLLLCWGLFGFLMTTVYNSELAAYFTMPFYGEKIQTEAQFLEYKYFWGSPDTDFWDLMFDMSDPTINKWVNNFHVFETESEREVNLLKDNYVIVGGSYGQVFYYAQNTKPPDELTAKYEVADDCALPIYTGVIFTPGSPYVQGVNLIFGRLISAGILQKDEYDLLMSHPRLRAHIPKNVFSLTKSLGRTYDFLHLPLSMFEQLFYYMVYAYVICTIILLLESANVKYAHRFKSRMKNASAWGQSYRRPHIIHIRTEEIILWATGATRKERNWIKF